MTISKNYFRIMLGRKSVYSEECHKGAFIGADYDIHEDLKNKLPDNWKEFNKAFIPVYLKNHPDKSKVAAGLACGALHTVAKGIKKGDIVLCPDGNGSYFVGEVAGDYTYHPGEILPHRRHVKWYPETIERNEMSQALQNSTGSIGTVSTITKHKAEIDQLLAGNTLEPLIATDESVEDPSVFALEKHLEDFLVHNWSHTLLGKTYDIYEDEGELVGRQYPSDTGPIDILAISKDKKELLVVELKKGRASDVVIGQIQRYMGYVLEELAEDDQTVRGVIVALDDHLRLRRALKVTSKIDFYRYKVSFNLFKA
jgi:restriction system protein